MILCVSLAALLCSLSHKLGGIHDHRLPLAMANISYLVHFEQ